MRSGRIELPGFCTQQWNGATGRKTCKLGVDDLMRRVSPATLAEGMPLSIFASLHCQAKE